MTRSITSANAIFMLAIAGLYPTPQQLQNFAADDIFSTEAVQSAEVMMGVDGNLAAGFVFVPVIQNVTLMANSDSGTIFDNWYAAQQAAKELLYASGTLILPSVGKKLAMAGGVLSSWAPLPDGGKTLKPRKFQFTWESVSPAPA